MGDLMDQYDTSTHVNTNPFLDDIEPISSGFVTVQSVEDKVPMFVKETVNVGSNVGRKIVDVAVANNVMIVVYEGCRVKRLDLANVAEFDVIEFSKNKEDEIERAFLDPSGSHLIVSLVSGESMYLGRNNKKPRVLAKLKNHKIKCVGWNKADKEVSKKTANFTTAATPSCTGQILFGTKAGLVLESEIDSEEKFLSMGSEKPAKTIFNVNEQSETAEPVCNIFMERVGRKHPNRFVVFVVTLSRFYQFVGDIGMEPPVFQSVFDVFKPTPAPHLELPSMLGYTDFSITYPRKTTNKNSVKHFAWLTEHGVYFGDMVDLIDAEVGTANITTNTRILPSTETAMESPVSMHVTEFHCLLLFGDKMKAVCTVNNAEVHEELFNTLQEGTMLGLRYDVIRRMLWAFSDSRVFRYNINDESRDVWKLYLDRKDFQLAKEYCKQNVVHMDEVWRREAEYLYDEGKYMQSAQCYALSQVSFEEVALKFLQVKDTEALKIYLQKKLFDLKGNDNTQLTMLVTWIIELYLSQLGDLRDKGAKEEKKYKQLENDFQHFLNHSRVHACLEQNKHVAYDLLSSHADTDNLIFFAMLMKDYPRVIRHHIQQDDFHAALDVLASSSEKKKRVDYHGLFEQFSPTLMQHVPGELVKLWKTRDLDPKKLIPALVTQSEKNDTNIRYVIDYLEHCVDNLGVNEEAIHNYLISLYCKVDDESALLQYLTRYAQDDRNVFFDKKYALRLCSENHKHEAAVKIYCAMELYEEAVDLALKEVDIETAKLCAEKPEFDDALRRKLWCKVARHVVEREEDIAKAMELLEECQAINKQTNRQCKLLKIEDILRFFPDFATIDHFKDAICESLQDYNQHIEGLKQAMQEATDSATTVRSEINDIRNRYGTVAGGDKCDMCGFPLVTRSFYYFPCSHVFHSDCLIAEVLVHLKDKQRSKLEEHLSMLTALNGPVVGSGGSTSGGRTREQVQENVDDIVAEECVLCGDVMIRSLDKPFIDENKFDEVMDSWR